MPKTSGATEYLTPGDRLFQSENGGILAGSVARRVCGNARKLEFTEQEYGSPMGKWIYDIRHSRLTKWLNDGIPPAQVAYWAVTVSRSCLPSPQGASRGSFQNKRRMAAQGDLPALPEAD
ncbi:hypothetical protein AB0C96_42590 [Streptomyces sp. NPDC048506]|uniref:hypothetical protein n=1 Tax=Streptomyces sp. NPDC048506 TaxID=3155028 RepID=UPI0034286FCF